MATQFADVITGYALPVIDDVRLQEELAKNPAVLLRRMSIFLTVAIPSLNYPPTLVPYLLDGLTEARYDDYYWVAGESETETAIETGKIGYELMSCQLNKAAQDGTIYSTPYKQASYDPETGEVTFPAGIAAGTEFQIDFYSDGTFANDLTPSIKRLLGLAIAIVWDERFTRNWLNMQQKIHDKSFDTVNEGTYMRESSNRLEKNRAEFFAQLRKYEQDCAYAKAVSRSGKRTEFV